MAIATTVDAKKARLGEKDALELAASADELYSVKGSKVTHLRLKAEKPDKATILAAMLGPTGNLRAPVVRQGRTLFVGFNEELFARLLK